MNQTVTLSEMQAALALADLFPLYASPLYGVRPAENLEPAVMESLRAKDAWNGSGSLSPEWEAAIITLVDPSVQAVVHIEGVGAARYYLGKGGIAAVAEAGPDTRRILGGLTLDTMLEEIHGLLPWRQIPDGTPMRFDLTADGLITVAALADAYREEQFRAVIERRAVTGIPPVSLDQAAHQIATGKAKPDNRWLVSILSSIAPNHAPGEEALEPGAGSLIRRGWAKPVETGLMPMGDLATLCIGFANVLPFLVLSVGAPWAEPEVTLFTRGLYNFWGISFYTNSSGTQASISRLGGRAMESMLRQRLAPFASAKPTPAAPLSIVASTPPPTVPPEKQAPVQPKAVAHVTAPNPGAANSEPLKLNGSPESVQPAKCAKCGTVLTKPFCTKCGMPAVGRD